MTVGVHHQNRKHEAEDGGGDYTATLHSIDRCECLGDRAVVRNASRHPVVKLTYHWSVLWLICSLFCHTVRCAPASQQHRKTGHFTNTEIKVKEGHRRSHRQCKAPLNLKSNPRSFLKLSPPLWRFLPIRIEVDVAAVEDDEWVTVKRGKSSHGPQAVDTSAKTNQKPKQGKGSSKESTPKEAKNSQKSKKSAESKPQRSSDEESPVVDVPVLPKPAAVEPVEEAWQDIPSAKRKKQRARKE
ncbi:hypothetical protein SprV_0301160600 [Sparganum proliferum]